MSTYPQDYIDTCRARVDAQVGAFRALADAVAAQPNGKATEALAALEPAFYNNQVLVLDSYFQHRGRALEGKDGNPINEVRVLCQSILANGDVMTVDKTIKLNPATSVLGHQVGDPIALSEDDFVALSRAYFAEIESRFAETP
ncbi:MAG: hypothetical protein ABWX96_21655 [Propionibacteriaceae bacterium]